MNTLIIYTYFDTTLFAVIPEVVFERYEVKLRNAHNQFGNTVDCHKDVYWLDAALCLDQYKSDYLGEHADAGCLRKYVIEEQDAPFAGPFQWVVFSGFAP